MKHLEEIHAQECVATLSIARQTHVSDARGPGREPFAIVPLVVQDRCFDLPTYVDSSAANCCDSAVTNCFCSTSSLSAWFSAKCDCFVGHLIVSDRGWIKCERRTPSFTPPEVMESSSEGQSDANK